MREAAPAPAERIDRPRRRSNGKGSTFVPYDTQPGPRALYYTEFSSRKPMSAKNNTATWLALDLGAESGRAYLGTLQNGKHAIEEIHRFPNEPVENSGSMHR